MQKLHDYAARNGLTLSQDTPLATYTAGPDVFYPETFHSLQFWAGCAEYSALQRQVALTWGLKLLMPLDNEIVGGKDTDLLIYEANMDMVEKSEAVLANLMDWRGPEPDSGTIVELTYALRLGRKVVGYLPRIGSYRDTVHRWQALNSSSSVDDQGFKIENFNNPGNLMWAAPLRRDGILVQCDLTQYSSAQHQENMLVLFAEACRRLALWHFFGRRDAM